jgi:hypothetical protein
MTSPELRTRLGFHLDELVVDEQCEERDKQGEPEDRPEQLLAHSERSFGGRGLARKVIRLAMAIFWLVLIVGMVRNFFAEAG